MSKRIKKLLKLAVVRAIRSDCFSRLAFSRTMWGLFLFLGIGVYFTLEHLWNDHILEYLKFLGPFFFGVRAFDSLTNVSIIKKEVKE
jgi:hypothetical protein